MNVEVWIFFVLGLWVVEVDFCCCVGVVGFDWCVFDLFCVFEVVFVVVVVKFFEVFVVLVFFWDCVGE